MRLLNAQVISNLMHSFFFCVSLIYCHDICSWIQGVVGAGSLACVARSVVDYVTNVYVMPKSNVIQSHYISYPQKFHFIPLPTTTLHLWWGVAKCQNLAKHQEIYNSKLYTLMVWNFFNNPWVPFRISTESDLVPFHLHFGRGLYWLI
jgi:hypothetical protein